MGEQRNKYRVTKATAKHLDPKSLMFSMFTAKDIRNLSVVKICTPLSFNILGHPLRGGLYDPALGPINESSDPCGTCGENVYRCAGHFGHIDLPVPVVNPLFHKALSSIIKLSCLKCFTLQIPSHIKLLLSAKLKLCREGYYCDVEGLEQEVSTIAANFQDTNDINIEYIQDIIDTYIETLRSRRRFERSISIRNDDEAEENKENLESNSKNLNAQWNSCTASVLKQFSAKKQCINCRDPISKVSILKNKIMTVRAANADDPNFIGGDDCKMETVLITPDLSKKYLRFLWDNESEVFKALNPCLGMIDLDFPTDIFFFEVVPVPPPNVRPINFLDGQIIEHPQSQIYKSIIQDCLVLRNIIQTIQDGDTTRLPEEGRLVFDQIRGTTATEKLHNAWQLLQSNIDHLMDRELSKTADSANLQGLKQIIEKKEGIIRMHMMGKRVNFAARSVITPDPNLNIDEIGIPEAFALKLTYPVPVTPWNVTELRQLIMNGPEIHPGAVMIENEDGLINRLLPNNQMMREAIAKRLLTSTEKSGKFFNGIKTVHRHLQNGDVLLLNRQPTLHKPSIMAHKARILKGEKTLRLHYANCKAYNADFDGDEMNAHYPQNELARSEGYFIANVSNQYLVPKDGTPLGGLIQDHVVSGVRLTLRGKFFSKQDYMQLVYSAVSDVHGDLILLPPTILKPQKLWSGKQIISTVIINIIPRGKARINLKASTKITAKEWESEIPKKWKYGGTEFKNSNEMSEAEVVIRNGELLSGVLDKTHYGATPYGLIHCIFELYGGFCSSKVLSAFGKLFQSYLQISGFTLGIEDILILRKSDEKRGEIIKRCRSIGEEIQRSIVKLSEETSRKIVEDKIEEFYWKDKFSAQLDRKYKTALDVFTNEINKTCLPAGLLKKFPDNNLQLMVQSGAKGSTVNTMQISCLLGQIELEGKRPPLMISGKSLPSFPAFDPTPRSGGFIDGRFMTGIQPQEFFFHCMAGREGLIDTAVKTSRSGYLQRCLIKHLEGLMVNYDMTVRDSDGSLVQINYGEDGLDIPNSRFLRKEQIDFLVENKEAIVDKNLVEHLKATTNYKKVMKAGKKIRKWMEKNGDSMVKKRISEFTMFTSLKGNSAVGKKRNIERNSGRSKAALSLMKKWINADSATKEAMEIECQRCPDPVASIYRQDLEFGVLSEHLEALLDDYVESRRNRGGNFVGKSEIRDLLATKVTKSLCPPGEPVGLLAAQSIGEPSTQMTLNTFHFAGRGEMNVTLGIPRLREILMMASRNIKTPSMEIPFRKDLANVEKRSNKLRVKLTKCNLNDVIKSVKIDRKMEELPHRRLEFTLTFDFLSHKNYKSEFYVNPREIIEKTEKMCFKRLFWEIKKIAKITGTLLNVKEESKRKNRREDETLDEENDGGTSFMKDSQRSRLETEFAEMHESSDEEDAAEDADASTARSVARHTENREYEDPEDEEIADAVDPENEETRDDEEAEENVENRGRNLSDDEEDCEEDRAEKWDTEKWAIEQRKKDVLDAYSYAIDYDFDHRKFSWCKFKFWLPLAMLRIDLPSVIKSAAKKVVLWETPLIKRAFTFKNPSGETILKTDGLNIVEMFKYAKILDLQRLYSNDIHGIAETYGIEAANRVIIKEVKDVFKMYGITVDSRHLSLIADYMTFDGSFQPLSRRGMENSASPLQQMSFESSLTFLRTATLQGKKDSLTSPSSRLMIGQPCKSGTGSFGVYLKTQSQTNPFDATSPSIRL